MGLARGSRNIKSKYQILSVTLILFLSFRANGDDGSFISNRKARRGLPGTSGAESSVFDVTKFNAKGDGKTDDTPAFIKAWDATCKSTTAAKFLVPKGTFLTGEVMFSGPCTAPTINFEFRGDLLAKPDCQAFSKTKAWIYIIAVNGITVNGGGTFRGQGEGVWKTRAIGEKGSPLPDSLVIANSNNSAVENINLVNSKGFQMKIFDVNNFTICNMNISSPGNSPNTDGIHVGRVHNVEITNSVIGVGDDCISIGDGSSDVTIKNITCGPGHGISIGSLGRYQDEKDVRNVYVSDCKFISTMYGARIKTFRNSPQIQATNITFTNLKMKDVYLPIFVDQNYPLEYTKPASKVKVSDIHFINIKGTAFSNTAVALNCSSSVPCEKIEMKDIDFTYSGNSTTNSTLSSACANVKPIFGGEINPHGCQL